MKTLYAPLPCYLAFKQTTVRLLIAAFAICIFPLPTCLAQPEVIEPTSSFTARLIGSANVLVGAPNGTEGTEWQTQFLFIKEGTSDRTVLEYDIRGRSSTDSAILSLNLSNLDDPSYTTLFMYSFQGNGLANAGDYYRTDNFVASFTDNGFSEPPFYVPFSFDVTDIYNDAIANSDDYLGFLIRNTTSESQYARYRIVSGLPSLTIAIPEPSSLCLSLTLCLPTLLVRRRNAQR